jgi:hypothetical protein
LAGKAFSARGEMRALADGFVDYIAAQKIDTQKYAGLVQFLGEI